MTQLLNRLPSRVFLFLGMVLILAVSISYLLNTDKGGGFHGDESGWISAAYYYADLLLSGDFNREAWECTECVAWGSLNPQLGKLLTGIPLAVLYDRDPEVAPFFNLYIFEESFQTNFEQGRVPPVPALQLARHVSIFFAGLTCVAAFAIMLTTADLAAGLLVVLALLGNQLFIHSATLALTDIHYNFFLITFLAPAIWFLVRPQRTLAASALCGVFAGLATSVKVTGIAVAGIIFLSLTIYSFLLQQRSIKDSLKALLVFSVTGIGVTFLFNPVFWPSLAGIQGRAVLDEFRTLLTQRPRPDIPFTDTLAMHYPQLGNLARPVEMARLVSRWNQLMSLQMHIGLWENGSRLVTLNRTLIEWMAPTLWLLLPLAVGLVHSTRQVVQSLRAKQASLLVVPLAFFVANYVFIVVFLKLNWARYYLPTVIGGSLMMALGASYLLSQLIRFIKRQVHNRSSL